MRIIFLLFPLALAAQSIQASKYPSISEEHHLSRSTSPNQDIKTLNITANSTALIVNGTPTVMTPELLQELFGPHIKDGNYKVLCDFIYNEAPNFFKTSLQNTLMTWLAEYNSNSPICLYLYLRLHHTLYSDQPLGHGQLISLWYKRYMAEILLEVDYCRLNIPQNDVELISHVRSLITRYTKQLDRWMENVDKIQVNKKELLQAVRERLAGTLSQNIDFHGKAIWLLSTEIRSSILASLSSYFLSSTDGQYFEYNKPTKDHHRIKKLAQYKRNKKQVGTNIRAHIEQALADLEKEIESLS